MSEEKKGFNIRLEGKELNKYNQIKTKLEIKMGPLNDNITFRYIINNFSEVEA